EQQSPEIQGFAVGDEIWITVQDPVKGTLHLARSPRRTRQPGLDPRSPAAARALLNHLGETGQWGLPEHDAVAVLLAEGHYRQRPDQDPVWLLPYQVQGIAADRDGRWLTREQAPWRPPFDRPRTHLQLSHDDPGVHWWLQQWPVPHEKPGNAPPLGALLEFLWITVPLAAPRRRIAPGHVAAGLAGWFRQLMERYPGLEGLYSAHVDACELGEALAFRIATLPPEGQPESEQLAWRVEAYRWIGAERCWPVLQ
ncbi:MAG TPA: hypothetical protein VD902_14215, partial [Symbiobacteriaceae bacterium]|nr:hypothetical protein [Symbiobacteriaceae bacterium]